MQNIWVAGEMTTAKGFGIYESETANAGGNYETYKGEWRHDKKNVFGKFVTYWGKL